MADENKCPHCGKPVPPTALGGICPECMLKAGLAAQTEGPGAMGPQGTKVVQPPPSPAEIASLFPQLEILECLGRGGMGVVYKARQPRLNRLVALKVLARDKEQDGQFTERFTREAQALARLSHPNIVAVHDFGEAGGHCYLVMEFVDGVNLRQVLLGGKMPPEQALAIVPKICEALQYAHEQGIVHRDIKPENILVDKSGRVKIADFGIAKMLGVTAGQTALTGAKDVVGTPHYMAPEQLEKPLTVDHRADIYSLGVVFYEMLTGELPLGKFAPPSKKVQIDVRLDEVVLHTLEKEPARRYQQVNQLKTDVETIAGTAHSAKGGTAPLLASHGIITSDKAIIPALLMAIFFGVFGAHRFYVGKFRTALLQLGLWFGCILLIIGCATTGSHYQPTLGILLGFSIFGSVIWATIDWILILCKAFTDGEGKRITHWTHPHNGGLTAGHETVTGSLASPPTTAPAAKAGAVPPSSVPPAFAATPGGKQPGAVPPAGTLPPAVLTGGPAAFNRAKVIAPAVGLMVAAALKLFGALTALFFFASPVREILDNVFSSLGMNTILPWHTLGVFSTFFFKVIPALLMLFGAVKMLQLRSYAWSIAAAILAIVCCSLVGFPVGIWALAVLSLPDVRAAFARQPEPAAVPVKIWPWLVGAAALGLILLVALALSVLSFTGRKSDSPNLTVRGTVTDAVTGKPIAGARVDDNRYGADTDQAPQQAWTDKSGHFKLKTWYEEHTIAASAPGYAPGLNTLFTKSFGSEREVWMDFKLQPARTNAPVTNGGSGSALNLSSQNGKVVIETTNGRLSADKVQLQAGPQGALALTASKIDYVASSAIPPAPPVPLTPSASPVPTVMPTPSSALPVRVKAGLSGSLTDSDGTLWYPDRGFDGGGIAERSHHLAIVNTRDPLLYRTERYDMRSFSYPVPNGKYVVKLHFAETNERITGPGMRVFTFVVEGHEFRDFDIWAEAGGAQRAIIKTVDVEVTDGRLTISFMRQKEKPVINGIEILPVNNAPVPQNGTASINTLEQKIGEASPAAPGPAITGTGGEPFIPQTKILGDLSTTDPFQQEYNQTFPFPARGRLHVADVNGRIEIAGWDRNEVVIKALKHGKTRESVDAARIMVNSDKDGIDIHTDEPSGSAGFLDFLSWIGNGGPKKATVDYAIQVPRTARLKDITSVNGRIVIEDVNGDIEASTVNGTMQVTGVVGDLKLSTVNGRITAELVSLGRGQSVSFNSVNGRIEAVLPANANADVKADTVNGSISSEFPALVVQKQFPVSKKLKGALGNGGASVKASTVNGGIHFRKGADAK